MSASKEVISRSWYDTVAGRDGTVNLNNIENLHFTDTTIIPTAPAVVNDTIAELYIAYFDQATDQASEVYWVAALERGVSITAIAEALSTSPQALALYPFLANPSTANTTEIAQFVTAIYQNLFDHAPNAAAQAYWVAQLQAGEGSNVGTFIVDLIDGAKGNNAATLQNKVTVADFYETQYVSHDVPFSATEAQAALAGVTHHVATVGMAEASILHSLVPA